MIIDFPDQKETVIEFSNRTFAKIVNDSRLDAFDAAIAGLAREEQRGLRSRFSFLVEHSVQCFALEEQALAFGLDILAELLTSHAPKANFLNTLRDTLTLGVAVKHGIPLQTEDKLLGKLAAARFGVNLFNEGEDIIVDFGTAHRSSDRRVSRAKAIFTAAGGSQPTHGLAPDRAFRGRRRRRQYVTPPLTAAEKALQALGITEPEEIDIEVIALSLGAKIKYRHLESCEARIVGQAERAIITVDSRATPRPSAFRSRTNSATGTGTGDSASPVGVRTSAGP